jgi:hypothetical protein
MPKTQNIIFRQEAAGAGTSPCELQRLQVSQQIGIKAPVNSRSAGRLGRLSEQIKLFKHLSLGVDGNHFVARGRIDGSVPQPFLNHGDINSGQQQMTGRRVALQMDRMKAFLFESWRLWGARPSQIVLTQRVESGAGQGRTALVDEEKIAVRRPGERSDSK